MGSSSASDSEGEQRMIADSLRSFEEFLRQQILARPHALLPSQLVPQVALRETVVTHLIRTRESAGYLDRGLPNEFRQNYSPMLAMAPSIESLPKSPAPRRTVRQVQVGESLYLLRRHIEGQFLPDGQAGWEFHAEELAPQLVGKGETQEAALEDWQKQVHVTFQRLYRKVAFEMSDPERALWAAVEQAIDLEGYEARTPLVLRQIGQLVQVYPSPYKVRWTDNRAEIVDLSAMPGDFAGFPQGQWFEAITERDRRTGRLLRVRHVQPTGPLRRLSGQELDDLWNKLPTTASLPRSDRDWTRR